MVGAGATGVDVGDEGMGGGCQGLEDAFGHCGTAYELLVDGLGEGHWREEGSRLTYVSEADEEDGDGFGRCGRVGHGSGLRDVHVLVVVCRYMWGHVFLSWRKEGLQYTNPFPFTLAGSTRLTATPKAYAAFSLHQ